MNPFKNCQSLLTSCQSGEILPNMIILVIVHFSNFKTPILAEKGIFKFPLFQFLNSRHHNGKTN